MKEEGSENGKYSAGMEEGGVGMTHHPQTWKKGRGANDTSSAGMEKGGGANDTSTSRTERGGGGLLQ